MNANDIFPSNTVMLYCTMYYKKLLLLYYKEQLIVKNTGKNTLQYCYIVKLYCKQHLFRKLYAQPQIHVIFFLRILFLYSKSSFI